MDKFTTLSISVTEEIESNKILTFIRTQIKLRHLFATDKSYFYFRFLPKALKYEIVLFQDLKDAYSSGIFSFYHLCNKEDQFTLFITSGFFALYQKNNLLVIKKIVDTSIEDITSYIEQTYKINLSNVVSIDNKRLQEIQTKESKEFKKKIFKDLHKFTEGKSFQYFSLYSLLLVLLLLIYLYENYFTLNHSQITESSLQKDNLLTKEEVLYKQFTNKNISKPLLKFLKLIAKEDLELKVIEYQGNSLKIQLHSRSKKELLKVLEYSNPKVVLKSIKQENSLEKYYSMEITLHD